MAAHKLGQSGYDESRFGAPIPMQLTVFSDRPQTEMTFGDLTSNSSDATFYESKKLLNKDL